MMKNRNTIYNVRKKLEKKYGTKNNTFNDFEIGDKVKIITPCCDHHFFYGETGIVVKNSGKYLGIFVQYDEPREYEDGTIQTGFNFNPKDLLNIEPEITRFDLMDI